MFIALSFIGTLPSYIVECVHQIRCFSNEDIYLIVNDLQSPHILDIQKYNVHIIPYKDVLDLDFIEIVKTYYSKFCIVRGLVGREELFIRSFERFFLLHNLMSQKSLEDGLFLELDNLIYEDPSLWIPSFSKTNLCYMYDNKDRFSSGLMYVKNANGLKGFLSYILHYISTSTGFISEMSALAHYYQANTSEIQILPTYWKDQEIPSICSQSYHEYNHTLFDALGIGCCLLGLDPYHTGGTIKIGMKASWRIMALAGLDR